VNTFITILLLWLLPALVLAPLLARAVFKRDPAEQVSRAAVLSPAGASAALNEQVHHPADNEPEDARNADQSEQAAAR
jgi:hypothetical protein